MKNKELDDVMERAMEQSFVDYFDGKHAMLIKTGIEAALTTLQKYELVSGLEAVISGAIRVGYQLRKVEEENEK